MPQALTDRPQLDRAVTAVPPAADVVLEVVGLTKTYRMGEVEVQALRGVTLRLTAGEFLVMVGPRIH